MILSWSKQRRSNSSMTSGRGNAVVGKIGQGKRRYGLGLIREKLALTQSSTIAINVLVINLQKLLELLFVIFAYWLQLLLTNEQGERPRFAILGPLISPA